MLLITSKIWNWKCEKSPNLLQNLQIYLEPIKKEVEIGLSSKLPPVILMSSKFVVCHPERTQSYWLKWKSLMDTTWWRWDDWSCSWITTEWMWRRRWNRKGSWQVERHREVVEVMESFVSQLKFLSGEILIWHFRCCWCCPCCPCPWSPPVWWRTAGWSVLTTGGRRRWWKVQLRSAWWGTRGATEGRCTTPEGMTRTWSSPAAQW